MGGNRFLHEVAPRIVFCGHIKAICSHDVARRSMFYGHNVIEEPVPYAVLESEWLLRRAVVIVMDTYATSSS